MSTKIISQERLTALENLAKVSRTLERCMSGPYQAPGYHDDIDMAFLKLKVAVQNLDRIEGWEMPIGHLHTWQNLPPI